MKEEKTAQLVVKENFKMSDISKDLKEKERIEHAWLFTLFARFTKAEEKIRPGEYEINSILDYRAMMKTMRGTAATLEEIRISIPEGFTLKQIFEELDYYGVANISALWEIAENHKYEYRFLENVPFVSNRLEGYLCPDTYDFYVGENPVSVLNKMLANFNRKFHREFRERADELGLTTAEIITIASLIEKEAGNDDERGKMASVIYNRLNSSNFPYLQIDASIQYFLSKPMPIPSAEELAIDNPYNTYKYEGLPPGPIANPGLPSIRAALYPEDTNFYFYALLPDFTHHFSRNRDEHDKVVRGNQEFYNSLR
jgi:UPF0755 protein